MQLEGLILDRQKLTNYDTLDYEEHWEKQKVNCEETVDRPFPRAQGAKVFTDPPFNQDKSRKNHEEGD